MNPSWRSLPVLLPLLLGLGSPTLLPAADAPAAPANPPAGQPANPAPAAKEPWRAMTKFNFAALPIDEMPPDEGNVAPIADAEAKPVGLAANLVKMVENALPTWAPGHVGDPVQRVRNHLFLLGAPDVGQSPAERFLPATVLRYLLTQFSEEELAQILCWIALHPDEGSDEVLGDPLLRNFGLPKMDPAEVRRRTYK